MFGKRFFTLILSSGLIATMGIGCGPADPCSGDLLDVTYEGMPDQLQTDDTVNFGYRLENNSACTVGITVQAIDMIYMGTVSGPARTDGIVEGQSEWGGLGVGPTNIVSENVVLRPGDSQFFTPVRPDGVIAQAFIGPAPQRVVTDCQFRTYFTEQVMAPLPSVEPGVTISLAPRERYAAHDVRVTQCSDGCGQ